MNIRFLFLFLIPVSLFFTTAQAQSNALSFDGNGDYVSITDANSLDLTGSYTIECWIKPDGFNSLAGLVSKYHSNDADGYVLRLGGVAPYTGINFDGMETATGVLTTGHWYHIAAVNDAGTRHLYVNGVEVPLTGTPITVAANTDELALGMDYQPSPRYFHGTMDEVRLWNVARTQNDIEANMLKAADPGASGLVAYYQMNEGTAGGDNSGVTSVTDATANGNNGTAVNFALNGNTSNWVSGALPGTVLYVDASATGVVTGGDWGNAFTSLSDALDFAKGNSSVGSILVAKGTYYPTGDQNGTNRDSAFTILRGGLKLLGGYPTGGGTRDPQANPVYLDGNINNAGNDGDNSYHIMAIAGLPAEADSVVVDGFNFRNAYGSGGGSYTYNGVSISQGNGGGIILHSDALGNKLTIRNCVFTGNCSTAGGGLLCHTNTSPLITHCTFDSNKGVGGDFNGSGGGLYNYNGSSPLITDCSFTGNTVNNLGGGLHNDVDCNATIINCIFTANSGKYGGGISNLTNTATIINCRITNNNNGINGGNGGGIYSAENAGLSVINCTVEGNTTNNNGSGIYASSNSTATIENSIIWNNNIYPASEATVNYSIVQGGYTGTGNIDTDPLFTDAANGDFTLQSISPAINTGSNDALPSGDTLDLTGNRRITGGTVDMGAYESNGVPYTVLYVDSSATTSGDGGSWASPLKTLSDALNTAASNTDIDSIVVAKGTYYPTGSQSATDRDSAFAILRGGLKLLGGYPAGGGERDAAANPVYLDGNINDANGSTDNSYHIMVVAGLSAEADSVVVDGFIFRNGVANGSGDGTYNGVNIGRTFAGGLIVINDTNGTKIAIRNNTFFNNTAGFGGGMVSYHTDTRIENCVFKKNNANSGFPSKGGGLYMAGGTPLVEGCAFEGNIIGDYGDGGGIYNYETSSAVISRSSFVNNHSSGGGGVYNMSAVSASFVNCLFYGNTGNGDNEGGGGMLNDNSSVVINSCTVTGNAANGDVIQNNRGGGIRNRSSVPVISNCIIWDNSGGGDNISSFSSNSYIEYSLVEGSGGSTNWDAAYFGADGGNNIDADPLFTDAANSDFTLQSASPAINTGSNNALPSGDTLDLAGNNRIQGGVVDMGAYEYQGAIATPVVLSGFSGVLQNGFAQLQWQTGVESNFSHFEIEKSVSVIPNGGISEISPDGRNVSSAQPNDDSNAIGSVAWQSLATINTKGNNSHYTYTVPQPEPTAYYRLKMEDNDGRSTYSNIVTLSQSNNNKILVYPNPAKDYINIKVANAGSIHVYDAAGRLMKAQALKAGVNRIELSRLGAGVYYGVINGQRFRFIKK